MTGASGLCCLDFLPGNHARGQNKLAIATFDLILDPVEIVDWVNQVLPLEMPGLVAVDAPTIIPNTTGTRLPDRLTHQYFGKYHAGCYPANLNRPFAPRTTQLGLDLEAVGFVHAPEITAKQDGRYQIEVFPHPAMVNLFNLDRIIKYKKGRLGDRRQELLRLVAYIQTRLPELEPALQLDSSWYALVNQIAEARGNAMKQIEDRLDALICAYVGAYWWYWGAEKNQTLGDRQSGYIIVPAPVTMNGQQSL
jgi:predicted RNase H-like nuclease